MLFFEAFVKFGAIGLMIAVGLLLIRDGRETRALRFGLPVVVAISFMFMTTGSEELSITGPLAVPMRLFDSMNSIFIWWLGLALFDDDFELGKREWFVAVLYAIIKIPLRMHYLGFDVYWHYAMNASLSAITFVLMAHLCYQAIAGHKEDLVEKRRRIRIWFVIAVAMLVITSVLAENAAGIIGLYQEQTIWITYIFTLPLTIWALLWLARLHPEVLAFERLEPSKVRAEHHHEDVSYNKLIKVMEEERVFTNHGLAIGNLADMVGLPSHQLRKLINQTMGFRNFSSFLNKYRIAEVKRLLADESNVRIPILTLAVNAGFSSLAPFNRAFKASEGITPTDFRAQSLTEKAEKPVQN